MRSLTIAVSKQGRYVTDDSKTLLRPCLQGAESMHRFEDPWATESARDIRRSVENAPPPSKKSRRHASQTPTSCRADVQRKVTPPDRQAKVPPKPPLWRVPSAVVDLFGRAALLLATVMLFAYLTDIQTR